MSEQDWLKEAELAHTAEKQVERLRAALEWIAGTNHLMINHDDAKQCPRCAAEAALAKEDK